MNHVGDPVDAVIAQRDEQQRGDERYADLAAAPSKRRRDRKGAARDTARARRCPAAPAGPSAGRGSRGSARAAWRTWRGRAGRTGGGEMR